MNHSSIYPPTHSPLRSQSGQMLMETMLIMMVLTLGMVSISRAARSQEWVKSMVSGPWKPIRAMIEDGVWVTANSKSMHPHHKGRHGSYEADALSGSADDLGSYRGAE